MRKRGKDYQFPQLGGDVNIRQVVNKKTGEPAVTGRGGPKIALSNTAVDLSDPVAVAGAKRTLIHSIDTASPETVQAGSLWYPKVSEAVSKGIKTRGFLGGQADRHLAGSAIVAAVSPNMDWEKNNIGAFQELKSLKSHHWDAIMRGGQGAKDVVKGMSISTAPLKNIQKAGRIIAGADPETELSYAAAPKTHSFMQNIHDPENSQFATIDGRAMDTLSNRMIPWTSGRGIGGATSSKSPPKRYTQAADIVRDVAGGMGISASAAQAISWTNVKEGVERKGGTRKQGPNRVGQPYFDPESGKAAAHDPKYQQAHKSRMAKFMAGQGI